jgi:hypothetical protein
MRPADANADILNLILNWVDTPSNKSDRRLMTTFARIAMHNGQTLPRPLICYTPRELLEKSHYAYAMQRWATRKLRNQQLGNRLLLLASEHGQLEAMAQGKARGAMKDYKYALWTASRNGQLEAMRLCQEWGATDYNSALWSASREGQLEAMRLCQEWGATTYDVALVIAACNGQLGAMRLCQEWGATNYDDALWNAAGKGHPEAMRLCQEWGATNYDYALELCKNMEQHRTTIS